MINDLILMQNFEQLYKKTIVLYGASAAGIKLYSWMKEIGLVMHIGELGVKESMFDQIIEGTFISDSGYKALTKEEIRKKSDFVIYNYIASQENVTEQQLNAELREKYGLQLNIEEVQKIILDYVKCGILSPRFRSYKVKSC